MRCDSSAIWNGWRRRRRMYRPVPTVFPARWRKTGPGASSASSTPSATDLVTALASQAASGKDIDTATLDRLDQAKALVASLHDAAGVQAAIDQMQPLSHWVDWTIAAADLQTVLQPVRDASSAAVAGFVNDDDDAMHNWPGVHDHYAPLINLVASAGGYADACNALPGDLVGELAKLATPLDEQPFADEQLRQPVHGPVVGLQPATAARCQRRRLDRANAAEDGEMIFG